jgi:hypothetical protein
MNSQTIIFEKIRKSVIPAPPPIGTPFSVRRIDTLAEERILVDGFSPRSSARFSFKRTLPLPDLPLIRSYTSWHPESSLFEFEVIPVEQWMLQTGCNTRILCRVFEATGRPPLFWNTQLRLHPLNSVWESLNENNSDNSEQEPIEEDDISTRVWPSLPTIKRIPFLNEESDFSEQEREVETTSLEADTRQSADGAPHNSPLTEDVEVNLGRLIFHYLNSESTADHSDDHLN